MGFRDDREAMRAHVETLKDQLDEQRDANANLQKQIDALGKRVDRIEPAPSSSTARRSTFFQATILAAFVGGLAALLVGRVMLPSDEPPASAETQTVPPEPEPALEVEEPPRPRPTPLPTPPVRYDGMAEWSGTVSTIEGRDDVSSGDRCVIRAEARSLAYHLAPERLQVRCGDITVYERAVSRRAQPNAFERWECEVRGQREDEGGLYAMQCSDRGVREDRPELEVDTLTKSARVFTDAFSIQIDLDHAAVRTSERMNPHIEMSLPVREALVRSGEVLRSNGPVSGGASCQLRLTPQETRGRMEEHHNCRANLRCGRTSVVDQLASCLVDEDLQLTGVRIGDEDSAVAVQGDLRTLQVASIGGERTWSAIVQLNEGVTPVSGSDDP